MKPHISVEAHVRYLAAPSVGALVLVVLVLFGLTRILSLLSLLAFALLSAALAIGLALELAVWLARGIRCLELDDETLTLYRGRSLAAEKIDMKSASRLELRSRLGRQTALIILRSGRRIRLSGEAFPEEAFGRFLVSLREGT